MDTTAIPHPPRRLPWLGDVVGVNPRTPVQDSTRFVLERGGICTRKILGSEFVLVSDPELVAEVNDEQRFDKHVGLGVRELRGVAGDGLFTAHTHEHNWQLAHDILLPAFTADSMRAYHPIMLDVLDELVASWDAETGWLDISAEMTKLTLETIGRTGFGYRFESFQRSTEHPFITAMTRQLRYSQAQALPSPVLRRLIGGAGKERETDLRLMNELIDGVIAQRSSQGALGKDLLSLMLNNGHPETGEQLDVINVRHQILTFLIAGHETTSGALSFALHFLTRNPDVLAKARAEVARVWGTDPDFRPDYRDVGKLRYVRRVLDESLRLWPTAPAYFREARQDVMLGGQYRMRRGDWVVVPLPALHRAPSMWGPDPEQFDPDRFEPARVKQRPGHVYKPFGTGARSCIGRQFAVHEAVLALGMLLRRYDFEPDPDYRLRVAETLTLKPSGFRLKCRPRRERATAAPAEGTPEQPAGDDQRTECPRRPR